jgi:hypothetical protein
MLCGAGGGHGCWLVLPGAGMTVEIYNLLDTAPQSTQSKGNNVFADFALFAVKQ